MNADHSTQLDRSVARKRHHPSSLEMVREYAREGEIDRPVSDEDATAVLDHFACPDELYRPMPDDINSPEFWAEIERRDALNLTPINARTVSAFLHER